MGTMVQLDLNEMWPTKKQYTHCNIIWCQGDFKEQIGKLVRLLLDTTKNCSRKG